MSTAVDTSVLIAGVLARHEHHSASHRELERLAASDSEVWLPVHAVLESYSVLTRLPPPHRIAPLDARELLRGSFGTWALAGPPGDVWSFLADSAARSVAGGAVYDALIVESALRVGARELVTWNVSHFERVARGRLVVRTP
jgi:predicted nucleic acid-binding protein